MWPPMIILLIGPTSPPTPAPEAPGLLGNSPLATTALTLLGVVITALLGYLGVRTTTRSARRTAEEAATRSSAVEQVKIDAQAYERARESYEAALAVSNQRIVGMQENIDRVRQERRADRDEFNDEVRDLRDRLALADLEQERLRTKLREAEESNMRLTVWARTVYAALGNDSVAAAMQTARVRVPRPPAGVSDTDPGGMEPYRGRNPHGAG